MNTENGPVTHRNIVDVLWCVALSLFILIGVPGVPLHGDEVTQIFMARDFYYHVQGDTSSVYLRDWDQLSGDDATEQQLRLINGTLPKYLFGMVAFVSGYEINDINQQWAWGNGWDWNHANGHVPADDLLWRTRMVSAALLCLSVFALFAVARQLSGRSAAYLASAFYVLNPAILLNGRRAMMEGGMLAFSILVILAALYFVKTRSWPALLAMGILSGLAVASKHTAVVTVFAAFVACGFILLLEKQLRLLAGLFGAGIVSILVFLLLSPAWWPAPVSAAQTVIELRQELLSGQVAFFGGYDDASDQLGGFLRQSLIVEPMYAESDYDGFLSEQADLITSYEQSWVSGIRPGVGGGILTALLTVVGIVYLWVSDHIRRSHAIVISTWLLATLALTIFVTPLEWQRYYLPIYPILAILAGTGAVALIKPLQPRLLQLFGKR